MIEELQLLTLDVNREKVQVMVSADNMLADVLRDKLGLTGVKKGCGEGECGACTVIVGGVTVNSCIYPVFKAQGKEIFTIEGLSEGDTLHPIQEAFIKEGAVQCGFCSPGAIMTSKWLLDNNPDPSEDEIKQTLAGNICRCTGYVKIINAVKAAARTYQNKT